MGLNSEKVLGQFTRNSIASINWSTSRIRRKLARKRLSSHLYEFKEDFMIFTF
ncbi:hypothetical protein HanIR_Chr16g0844611 [Helianthus annuus]|nr:hypothetical protein HanIR_Chr16g0844611 [Helianthus annuus]